MNESATCQLNRHFEAHAKMKRKHCERQMKVNYSTMKRIALDARSQHKQTIKIESCNSSHIEDSQSKHMENRISSSQRIFLFPFHFFCENSNMYSLFSTPLKLRE